MNHSISAIKKGSPRHPCKIIIENHITQRWSTPESIVEEAAKIQWFLCVLNQNIYRPVATRILAF